MVDVEPEQVEWLWPGRLPIGKLVVLDGDPGCGKSTLTLDLAAHFTTGSVLPDGSQPPHPDQDIRGALAPLARMGETTRCRVIAICHFNKSGGNKALYRGGGPIGIVGAAQVRLIAGTDPGDEDRRILAVTKSNLSAPAYRVIEAPENLNTAIGFLRRRPTQLLAASHSGPRRSRRMGSRTSHKKRPPRTIDDFPCPSTQSRRRRDLWECPRRRCRRGRRDTRGRSRTDLP